MGWLESVRLSLQADLPMYIMTHESPDGDAIGSGVALTCYLGRWHEVVFFVLSEPVTDGLQLFLDGVPICDSSQVQLPAQWLAVDCGRSSRVESALRAHIPMAVIDHHPEEREADGTFWGVHRWIHPEKAATCEILSDLMADDGYGFDDATINNALYLGLVRDTGDFSYSNVTPSVFACAERLVQAGVRPHQVTQRIYKNRTVAQLKLLSVFLSRTTVYADGAIVIATLTAADYEATQTAHRDTEGFVYELLRLRTAKVAAFVEHNATFTKVSLRASAPAHPVNGVAKQWGGGGHPCAASFKCDPVIFSLEKLVNDLKACIA